MYEVCIAMYEVCNDAIDGIMTMDRIGGEGCSRIGTRLLKMSTVAKARDNGWRKRQDCI